MKTWHWISLIVVATAVSGFAGYKVGYKKATDSKSDSGSAANTVRNNNSNQ